MDMNKLEFMFHILIYQSQVSNHQQDNVVFTDFFFGVSFNHLLKRCKIQPIGYNVLLLREFVRTA